MVLVKGRQPLRLTLRTSCVSIKHYILHVVPQASHSVGAAVDGASIARHWELGGCLPVRSPWLNSHDNAIETPEPQKERLGMVDKECQRAEDVAKRCHDCKRVRQDERLQRSTQRPN